MMEKDFFFKSALLSIIFGSFALGVNFSAQAAASYRVGTALNQLNPADMSATKNYEVVVDGFGADIYLNQYNFSINGVPGSAPSSHGYLLPFFHINYRLDPKWVVGLVYSHPFYTEIGYGLNSFVNGFSVTTRLHSLDLSPRVSYQVTPHLALGLGLDALHFSDAELSNQVPTNGSLFSIIENGKAWDYGWDAGVYVTVRKGTYASLAFFSPINSTINGQSRLDGRVANVSLLWPAPTTLVLRLTQFIKPTWVVRFAGYWNEQSVLNRVAFTNTARGNLTFPLDYNNTYLLSLLTNYQINKRWGFTVGGTYEDGPQPVFTLRPALPTGDVWSVFGGPSLTLTKIASLRFIYAHAWSKVIFDFNATAGRGIGFNRTTVNIFDLQLAFKA